MKKNSNKVITWLKNLKLFEKLQKFFIPKELFNTKFESKLNLHLRINLIWLFLFILLLIPTIVISYQYLHLNYKEWFPRIFFIIFGAKIIIVFILLLILNSKLKQKLKQEKVIFDTYEMVKDEKKEVEEARESDNEMTPLQKEYYYLLKVKRLYLYFFIVEAVFVLFIGVIFSAIFKIPLTTFSFSEPEKELTKPKK